MKKLLLLTIYCSIVIASCGGDGDCTAEMVAGTYIGSIMCDDPENNDEDVLIRVEARGDDIVITDDTGEEFEVELNGCQFTIPEITVDVFGIQLSISGDGEFDGPILTFDVVTTFSGISETCRFEASLR